MSSLKNQSLYTLEPYNFQNSFLLQLDENDAITATAEVSDLENANVYFYVNVGNNLSIDVSVQYQFRPFNQPDKYIAVVDGKVDLKKESECTESERTFFIHKLNDYYVFSVKTDTIYHLGCDNAGKLYASTSELREDAMFNLQLKDSETKLEKTEEGLMFELVDIISDIFTDVVDVVDVVIAEE